MIGPRLKALGDVADAVSRVIKTVATFVAETKQFHQELDEIEQVAQKLKEDFLNETPNDPREVEEARKNVAAQAEWLRSREAAPPQDISLDALNEPSLVGHTITISHGGEDYTYRVAATEGANTLVAEEEPVSEHWVHIEPSLFGKRSPIDWVGYQVRIGGSTYQVVDAIEGRLRLDRPVDMDWSRPDIKTPEPKLETLFIGVERSSDPDVGQLAWELDSITEIVRIRAGCQWVDVQLADLAEVTEKLTKAQLGHELVTPKESPEDQSVHAHSVKTGWPPPDVPPYGGMKSVKRCPDGGYCHHRCDSGPGNCWRVSNCGPMSGNFSGDEWPEEIKAAHGCGEPQKIEEKPADQVRDVKRPDVKVAIEWLSELRAELIDDGWRMYPGRLDEVMGLLERLGRVGPGCSHPFCQGLQECLTPNVGQGGA